METRERSSEGRETKRRKLQHQNPAPKNDNVDKPLLLALPAEIRNTIYGFALTSENQIAVTPDLKQPPLLWTCRQVRQEARGIWYSANKFCVELFDCDDGLLSAFTKHMRSMKVRSQIRIVTGGRRDWTNLMIWCKNVWNKDSRSIRMRDELDNDEIVMAAALQIAKDHMIHPWSECEASLENLEAVVRRLDPSWV